MTRSDARSGAAKKDVIPRKPPLPCPDCHGRLYLKLHRLYGLVYLCENRPACLGSHGAHPDGAPMGTPAGKDVRMARIRAHGAFDGLWIGADALYSDIKDDEARQYVLKVARKRAYAWLRDRLGLTREECHIGEFNAETCAKVVEICRGMSPELVRAWAKEQKALHGDTA